MGADPRGSLRGLPFAFATVSQAKFSRHRAIFRCMGTVLDPVSDFAVRCGKRGACVAAGFHRSGGAEAVNRPFARWHRRVGRAEVRRGLSVVVWR